VFLEKIRLPSEFNEYTYKSLMGTIFENRGLRLEMSITTTLPSSRKRQEYGVEGTGVPR